MENVCFAVLKEKKCLEHETVEWLIEDLVAGLYMYICCCIELQEVDGSDSATKGL